MKASLCSILAGLCLGAPAAAGQWEAGVANEHLTKGKAPWRNAYLLGEWRSPAQWVAYGGLRQVERYSLQDDELHAGAILPLPGGPRLQVEAGTSRNHHVLPEYYGALRIEGELARGLVAAAGWRRSAYDEGMTSVGHVAIERYFGSQRIGYTLYEGRPDGADFSASHRLHWAWHYDRGDERSWIGIAVVRGRETEHAGASGFLTSRVHGYQLSGMHWFSPRWGVNWEAGQTSQGDFYTRRGFRLGLRHAF